MGVFVHFLQLFDHRIHSCVDIELILIDNVKFRLNFYMKLVSFKNIDTCPIYGPKSYLVRIPKYGLMPYNTFRELYPLKVGDTES